MYTRNISQTTLKTDQPRLQLMSSLNWRKYLLSSGLAIEIRNKSSALTSYCNAPPTICECMHTENKERDIPAGVP